MADQNAHQPAESAPASTVDDAVDDAVDDQADRIFRTESAPPPVADAPPPVADAPPPVADEAETAPILRRRQPTVIPKLQGRRPSSTPAAPQPVVYPALASLAAGAPADPPPPDPEQAARKKLWWLSGAAAAAVVMIATGVLLSVHSHSDGDQSSTALPPGAVASVLPAGAGLGSFATSAAPIESLGGPTEAATRTAAPRKPAHTEKPAPTGLPNPSGVNLALHKPVTVSGIEGVAYAGAEAVDGDLTTRWSSAWADPQWIRIDLGALRQIKQVKLTWERSYAVAFRVQTSADGHTWKSVYSTTSGQGGAQTVKIPKAVGRYLRIYGTKRVTTYGYSLFEIDVR